MVQIDPKLRANLEVAFLIATYLICLHWTVCIIHYIVKNEWQAVLADTPDIEHDLEAYSSLHRSSFWLPPSDIGKGISEYYSMDPKKQYIYMLYYSLLLLLTNDITPTTQQQTLLFISCILVGIFVENYILGGISAQILRTQHKMKNS